MRHFWFMQLGTSKNNWYEVLGNFVLSSRPIRRSTKKIKILCKKHLFLKLTIFCFWFFFKQIMKILEPFFYSSGMKHSILIKITNQILFLSIKAVFYKIYLNLNFIFKGARYAATLISWHFKILRFLLFLLTDRFFNANLDLH